MRPSVPANRASILSMHPQEADLLRFVDKHDAGGGARWVALYREWVAIPGVAGGSDLEEAAAGLIAKGYVERFGTEQGGLKMTTLGRSQGGLMLPKAPMIRGHR